MEREHATIDPTTERHRAVEPIAREDTTTPAGPAATIAATRTDAGDGDEPLPNTLTIIGRDTPSSFEFTVDGEIELLEDDRGANTTIVSGTTVEGTIEAGTIRFGFTGDLTDVTFVDRQITGLSPAAVPNVHVDYSAPERSRS